MITEITMFEFAGKAYRTREEAEAAKAREDFIAFINQYMPGYHMTADEIADFLIAHSEMIQGFILTDDQREQYRAMKAAFVKAGNVGDLHENAVHQAFNEGFTAGRKPTSTSIAAWQSSDARRKLGEIFDA